MFFSYQGEGLNNTIAPYSTYIYKTLTKTEAIRIDYPGEPVANLDDLGLYVEGGMDCDRR